jgi:DNA-binding CsgD family transcriptional regulator
MPLSDPARLTPRERDVLRLLLGGNAPAAVGEKLEVAVSTVRSHIKHLHEKTSTHSLSELIAWGYEHRDGWDPEEDACA